MSLFPVNYSRRVIFSLYFFANAAYSIYFISAGRLGGDFRNYDYPVEVFGMIFVAVVTLVLLWAFMVPFFEKLERILRPKSLGYVPKTNFVFDLFFLALSVFNFLYKSHYGGGIGGEFSESNALAHYAAALLLPQWLLPIYFFYRIRNWGYLYSVILIIYVASSVIGGLTGSLVLVFFLYLTKKSQVDGFFSKRKVKFFLALSLAIYPIFRFFKSVFIDLNVNKVSSIFSIQESYFFVSFREMGWLSAYYEMFFESFERLQMVSSQYYLLFNFETVLEFLNIYGAKLFFENTWEYAMLHRRLGLGDLPEYSLQNIVAMSFSGSGEWSSQVGFMGHFISGMAVGLLYVAVSFLLLIGIIALSKVYDRTELLVNFAWWSALTFFFHGWFFATVEIFRALILFGFVIFFLDFRNLALRSFRKSG